MKSEDTTAAENTENTENTEATNEANGAEGAAEAPKKPAVPREPKYSDTSVIKLLTDKDGKQYGPENNPKKPGSNTAARFAKYVDGMTVKDAREAGIYGDLSYDAAHNFIEIV
jgi:hypothetical protein